MADNVGKSGRRKKRKKPHSGLRPKQYSDRTHAKRRLEERYGIVMNRETRLAIERAIKSGQAILSDDGYNTKTRSVFKNVVPGDPDIPIVYSFKTGSPVTCLENKKAAGK